MFSNSKKHANEQMDRIAKMVKTNIDIDSKMLPGFSCTPLPLTPLTIGMSIDKILLILNENFSSRDIVLDVVKKNY